MKLYQENHRRWLAEYADGLLQQKKTRTLLAAVERTFEQFPLWDTAEYRSTIRADVIAIQKHREELLAQAKAKRLAKEQEALRPKKSKGRRHVFQGIREVFKSPRANPPSNSEFVIDEQMRREAEQLAQNDPDT